MSHRCLAALGVLAAVIVVVSLVPAPVAGQVPSSATKSSTPPRTAWGEPDLQGVWDFRSLTPLERPSALAEKQVLTDEEVAQREEQATALRDSDIDPATGKLKTSADGVVPYNQFWMDFGTTVDKNKRTSLIVDPPDGRLPPLTPEAQKKQAAVAEARRGVGMDEPTPGGWVEDLGPHGISVRCIQRINEGPPMSPSAYNNNVQLFQTPGSVAILTEQIHTARIVPLDGRPHLPQQIRQWSGDSRGRWEGNTLVVDTTNFTRLTTLPLRQASENTHLVERFTRVDADTLLYEFTVEDPVTWTRPWTAQVFMRKSRDLMYEYACHEGNYSLAIILAGARAKEKAVEEAAKKGSR